MSTRMPGRLLALAISGGLLATAATATTAFAEETPDQKVSVVPGNELDAHDLELLADARQAKQHWVTMMLAADDGQADAIEEKVRSLGGTVGFRDEKIGYLRATLPIGKVAAAAELRGVLASDLAETLVVPQPADLSRKPRKAGTYPGPDATTPDANPYMPTQDMGAVTFKTAHPKYDGRGVTIGVLDSGVDPEHEALATTTTGEDKLVDWFPSTDPVRHLYAGGDASWRIMLTEVQGPEFTLQDNTTWKAPAGTYKINRFNESSTRAGDWAGDVNRDGDTTDRWGVLYDPETHDIWVDSDQDFDFTDEVKQRPFAEERQVGHFGVDNPDTPKVIESTPFVVSFREDVDTTVLDDTEITKADFVNIGIQDGSHGTHVAGIAAGHKLFGGTMNGVAPGAKVVSGRACWGAGCENYALVEGMVDMVANHGVDVVNMSIGGLDALNDGADARDLLYDRIIDEYAVQLFISAGNSGPGLNTVGSPSTSTSTVSVGSSITKQTWAANYGSEVSAATALHNYSSRGPREDGGQKPNIIAPGSAISSVAPQFGETSVPEAGYPLPPGYAHFNGTSMASPQAAGGAALLLSASFDKGIAVTPKQLRTSIYSSAKKVGALKAHEQGYGLFDVPAAWALLKKQPETNEYQVSAPVCTPISEHLATPHKGTGIYNRCAAGAGGQTIGKAKSYRVKITRTSGRSGTVAHTLKWSGNDGTFTAPSKVRLPKDKAVTITIKAKARSGGVHSGLLRLDDPKTKGLDGSVLSTVVVATNVKAPSFGTTVNGKVERNRTKSYFINVPEGAKTLQVNLGGLATKSQTRFVAIDPLGLVRDSTSSLNCYSSFSDPNVCKPSERDYADPMPGIWEFEVESRRTSPFLSNPYRLTLQVQGLTVDPASQEIDSVKADEPTPLTWNVTNDFGSVRLVPTGGDLGSAKTDRPSIGQDATQEYDVEVPAGASRLDVKIGNTSDLGADLDLVVLKDGEEVASDADGDSEEAVSIASPDAGTYTVQVIGYAVPAGTTEYDYLDAFLSPGLGSLTIDTQPTQLASGQKLEVTGTLTAKAAPAEGRQLFGSLRALSGDEGLLGTGDVLVKAVTQ
ncbi:S8 family serine peptidase [Nocardioides speluncae]|uniref:S8 family serine peptidase n=1 Tax=Nocardioides speluncae TaxID=2670337 RepID=UPI000D689AED|nr:S8 family serine peptidase [Nocardioides speluncae]